MAIEPSITPQSAVRPVNDADRAQPDARQQSKRYGKKRRDDGKQPVAPPPTSAARSPAS